MLPRSFFERPVLEVAQALIGTELHWHGCSGLIVETEAYAEFGDEACHAFLRPAARAFIAERAPGTAYVYLNYGIHWMLNVLTKCQEEKGLILIRALEPRAGIGAMQARRAQTELRTLCSGPGKLGQALGITGEDHTRDLCDSTEIGFSPGADLGVPVADVRVGISKAAELPWRFLAPGSKFVSVPLGKVRPMAPRMESKIRPALKPVAKKGR